MLDTNAAKISLTPTNGTSLMLKHLSIAAFAACIASGVNGHEFWIDPERHVVAPGEEIVAATRVGELYEGNSYSYVPNRARRFDYASGGTVTEVTSRMGDNPAFRMTAPEPGLFTIIHVTGDSIITWDEFEKFETFVRHKDAAWTLEAHDARGLSKIDVSEVYSRYAKSLVAVGDGAGADRDYGLLTEITALENPYTGDVDDGIDVKVTYEGAPRANTQVEVFQKGEDGAVEVFTVKTDTEGIATVPVQPGHRYMLDAVVLREPSAEIAEARRVVWESLWANLTFEVPAR